MAKKHTKKALFTSVMSLVLCCAMLIGTTFAWFTDSVSTANNLIQSGNLDIELYWSKDCSSWEKVDASTNVFEKNTLWEPGHVEVAYLKVVNEGSLNLKYQLGANVVSEIGSRSKTGEFKLSDYIKYGVAVPEAVYTNREDAIRALSSTYSLSTPYSSDVTPLEPKAEQVVALVVYMPETVGNEANFLTGETAPQIVLGLNVVATQVEAELDSFNNDYDKDATMPDGTPSAPTTTTGVVRKDGSLSVTVASAPSATTKITTVEAPADSFEPGKTVEMTVSTVNGLGSIHPNGVNIASMDIDLLIDGKEVAGKDYTVTTYIAKGLADADVDVYYDGNGEAPVKVSYDPATGMLVYKTTHFSKYVATGAGVGYVSATDTAILTLKELFATEGAVIPEATKPAVMEMLKTAVENGEFDETASSNAMAQFSAAKINDVYYVTLADAWEAAQDRDTIVVLNDIATSDAITNTKTITLDLNGKTIAGTDNATGSFGLITNKGELTVTGNGKMTLTATNNRGWNAYSSVISNTVGGKLIVESGTIEHLGGTDMAYGIDNLTNGKGTYAETVINGGTIKSTYRAIRQFLNGVEAQNILTVNGGIIEGTNKSIWMQDPSKNANTGTLTVGADAVLNGDVYLSVDKDSTEWPVVVSIAAAALGENDLLTNNVPYGLSVVNVNGTYTLMEGSYEINSLADLKKFRDEVNAGNTFAGQVVYLKADIDLNNEEWTPIGTKSVPFNGIFEGNGHTISNLLITGYNSYVGLFGHTQNGEIKNLTVNDADVSGRTCVGVVAGQPYTSKYTNITVTGHVEVNGMAYVGGVGGYNAYADWTNITVKVDGTSYVKANSVENGKAYRSYVGGVIGFMGEGGHKVSKVTSNINVYGSTCDVGGIVGIAHYNNVFEDVTCNGYVEIYAADEADAAEEIGGIAGVWHNQNGTTVTFNNCAFTSTLKTNITDGVNLSDNTVTGKAYSETGSGKLIIDGKANVVTGDAATLATELAAGSNVKLTADINNAAVATTAPYGNKYGVAQNGGVLDGNGKTLDFEIGPKNYDNYGIMTSGGTIKNVTITGVFRGIMIMNPTEDVYIDNVTIGGDEDMCYGINTGEGDGTRNVVVTNSNIKGWNSFGTTIKSLKFTDCTFGQGTYYTDVFGRLVKPYVDTVFENCDFSSMYYIDLSSFAGANVTLKNCSVNGVKLTAENWTQLIVAEGDCGEGQISIEAKNGTYMSASNALDYVSIQ